jgi:hypothetical protein
MSVPITTQIIHASFASVIRQIDANANIYDNPNQQGTAYPAWFIVHRSPVEVQREFGKIIGGNRYTLTYQIDIWYMIQQNITRLYDQYTQVAEALDAKLEYLPIFGSNAVVHVFDRSWSLELQSLKYSTTLRLLVFVDNKDFVYEPFDVITLDLFLKNQNMVTLSFTNEEHPEFVIELPSDIVVERNEYVKLPSVFAREEVDDETWVPYTWDIGGFGSLVKMDENKTANLLWKVGNFVELSFVNISYPQFDVDLPDPIIVEVGTNVTLPYIHGEYIEESIKYEPEDWSIGGFGESVTINEDTVANLLWQAVPIGPVYPQGQFLYGEMQTNPNKQVTLNAIPIEESSNELMTVTGNAIWLVDHPFIPDEGFDMVLGLNGLMEEWVPPVIVLPTVTKIGDLRIAPNSFEQQLASGSSKILYEQTSDSYKGILYDDTTKKQCVYGWDRIVSGAWEKHYYGVSAVLMNTGNLGVINNTQSTIYVYYIRYAECSDPTAEVITVYDSSNNPFNAFKYTTNDTDYYYVLDGVQTDWTDDFSSVGYYLHHKTKI